MLFFVLGTDAFVLPTIGQFPSFLQFIHDFPNMQR